MKLFYDYISNRWAICVRRLWYRYISNRTYRILKFVGVKEDDCAKNDALNKQSENRCDMTGEEFANELKQRLNCNLCRYHGVICNGREFPNVEAFDVDEVYECIDRILDGIPEDTND